MNKKERFQAVRECRAPDRMPVWSCALSQPIFGQGLLLPDVTGQNWYDSSKITEVILKSIKNIDYDLAIPFYVDFGFGVPPLGGKFDIPNKFGVAVTTTDDQPVKTKDDWPKVQKKLAIFDVRNTDPRMKSALEVIKNVSKAVGDIMPLVPFTFVGSTAAMFLFRPGDAFMEDIENDPEWVDEMCRVATDWSMDWIRAQYEAGANSVAFIVDVFGTLMASPKQAERFNLSNVRRVAEMVKKEFNQGVWMHLHGDMKQPEAYEYLTRLVKEAGIEGLHLDENHPPEWVKENVVKKFGIPSCIMTNNALIAGGPIDTIKADVKDQISKIGDGLGVMMAPSCQILPATPNEHFKAWVDATHEYGKYPLGKRL
jgi:uroporphyrinogen-III decarboxylase